jgi:hypothetical protein
MPSFRLRPRFSHFTDRDFEDIRKMVEDEIKTKGASCKLDIRNGHISVKMPENERHFWSPQLDLMIEKEEGEEKTLIRGHYGPNPNTWALFTYGYVILGILFVFVGIWGLSKFTLHKPAPELWLLLVITTLALALYIIAQFGQKLGAEQMFKLHFFYEKAIGEKINIE